MTKKHFKESYPIYTTLLSKNSTSFINVDAIIDNLKTKINTHPIATYIATFDNHAHTSALEVGKVSPEIKEAKNIICCFGKELMVADILSLRPRSIGVADMGETFHISFLEAPNVDATNTMINWVKTLEDK